MLQHYIHIDRRGSCKYWRVLPWRIVCEIDINMPAPHTARYDITEQGLKNNENKHRMRV